MFIREFRLHLLLEYNAACTCGISRRLPITPITPDSSVGTSIPSLTHRQQYITISFSLCQYYGIIFCIFSNKSDRFGNVNFQPQGKHMTLLIQLHALKCQLIHLLQSQNSLYKFYAGKKNRNWSNYVTHHQNCCERKAIPSEFLKKKSSKFLYCTRNIVMNVSVTNRFSANIKFDPQIIRTRSRTQDTGSTYNSSGVKATTMTSRA